MSDAPAIGIDLGTTYSAAACIGPAGRVELIPNEYGRTTTPSIVQFPAPDRIVVGWEAHGQLPLYPDRTAQFFKRDMGTDLVYTHFAREWTPVTLSAELLRKIKADVENHLGREVSRAVVTVPAYFRDGQRRATMEAGRLAGLEVLQTFDEPAAAAVAYGAGRAAAPETILVYDLGGGTFDVSVARIEPDDIHILGHDGNPRLGGKDWDDLLLQAVCDEFERRRSVNPLDDPVAFRELLLRVEELKRSLSAVTRGSIVVSHEGIRERIEITRESFEELTRSLMAETDSVMSRLLGDLQMSPAAIDRIVLAGGSTRMPMVTRQIRARFGKPPGGGVNPDECVACGAAIRAHDLVGEPAGGRSGSGGALTRIHDRTAHSLGMIVISADGSRYENATILAKHSPVPSEASEIKELETVAGRDNTWDVYLLQGDSPVPTENTVLGLFTFSGVPHHGGRTRVKVVYRYDRSTITHVEGYDEATGSSLGAPRFTPPPLDIDWTLESPRDHQARTAGPRVAAVLCIDVSGSMSGFRLAEAKKGALAFHRQLAGSAAEVALVTFDSGGSLIRPLSPPDQQLVDAIGGLQAGGGTTLSAGLRIARTQLAGREGDGTGSRSAGLREAVTRILTPAGQGSRPLRRVVIVLTDGETSLKDDAVSLAGEMKHEGIEIVAIGTGEADRAFLGRIASTDDMNLFVNAEQLGEAFGSIARNLTRDHLQG